jgi:NAD(P)-dependent dehydrogenase (short-subunit alcohol dehydrogenase family)
MMNDHEPSVLITGASRGLGAALAESLARQGARVVLVARGRDALELVAAHIRDAGGEAHALAFDIADKHSVHALAGAAQALVGPIDVLVHNASALGPLPMPLLLDTACEALQAVIETNLIGPFRLTKLIAGHMALRGRGLVIHISSDAAISGYSRWGAYGVSKAALDHLARVWGAELASMGVRFLSVDPGEMDTRMHADAMPDADPATLARPDAVAARLATLIQHAERWPTGSRLELAALDLADRS